MQNPISWVFLIKDNMLEKSHLNAWITTQIYGNTLPAAVPYH